MPIPKIDATRERCWSCGERTGACNEGAICYGCGHHLCEKCVEDFDHFDQPDRKGDHGQKIAKAIPR